jgi:hypothetical protein
MHSPTPRFANLSEKNSAHQNFPIKTEVQISYLVFTGFGDL